MREAVAPGWLVDIVRPKPVTVPWPLMVRAALAICVPMAAGLLAHDLAPGLLAAMGGLIAVIVDVGGPYLARLKRVGSAAVFGGAVGLTIGAAIHGRGWIAVVVLVLLAGVSVVVSEMGSTGSVVGLQLLVFASLGLGPLGGLRPWWTGPLEFLIGVAWAMILIIPGWILYPRSAEQHSVAEVYRALAARLRSVGTDSFAADRRALTAALNVAYDQVLTARSGIGGGNPQLSRLVALLNHSFLVAEATNTLALEGTAPPASVAGAVDALADSISCDRPPHALPPAWSDTPGARALGDALRGAVRLIEGQQISDGGQPEPPGLRERLRAAIDRIRAGRLTRLYALRLMASIGVAAVASEILPLQRSYWVVLTVAFVLKPDFGSVFARALQRGIGTIVGAVIGAIILVAVPYGLGLLIRVRGPRRAAAVRAQPQLRPADHVLDPAGRAADRHPGPNGLAPGRGPADRHPARLRDRPGDRVRPLAGDLAGTPVGPVRRGHDARRQIYRTGTGRSLTRAVTPAQADLP